MRAACMQDSGAAVGTVLFGTVPRLDAYPKSLAFKNIARKSGDGFFRPTRYPPGEPINDDAHVTTDDTPPVLSGNSFYLVRMPAVPGTWYLYPSKYGYIEDIAIRDSRLERVGKVFTFYRPTEVQRLTTMKLSATTRPATQTAGRRIFLCPLSTIELSGPKHRASQRCAVLVIASPRRR